VVRVILDFAGHAAFALHRKMPHQLRAVGREHRIEKWLRRVLEHILGEKFPPEFDANATVAPREFDGVRGAESGDERREERDRKEGKQAGFHVSKTPLPRKGFNRKAPERKK
jgi:hypothetical protein